MNKIAIVGGVLIVFLLAMYFMASPSEAPVALLSDEESETIIEEKIPEAELPNNERRAVEDVASTSEILVENLKTDTFTGTLEAINTGCYADGECFAVVGGKHVTVIMGWSQQTVGSVVGADGFGDLETYIGQEVEVYAQESSEGKYTLYGSEGFYIKVK